MSMNCVYSGECGGCMACQEDRFIDEVDEIDTETPGDYSEDS